jgi:hypothetical protein
LLTGTGTSHCMHLERIDDLAGVITAFFGQRQLQA